MATSRYSSTEETTNANRANRLILGPCTDQLRDVLRHHVPPATFTYISKQKRSNLPRLTAPQMNLILPRGSYYTGNYDDMDISLLYILLRHICSIPPHRRGWGYDPNPTDRSLSANIERIRIARNQCVFSSSPTLSNADFNIIWSTVRAAVVDIDSILNNGNQYVREVDFLRHETVDPVPSRHYIEELRKQCEEDAAKEILNQGKHFINAMATSRYSSTEETTNAFRANRLILGPCIDQLRDVLRHHVPPATFTYIIKQKRSNLLRLTAPQMNLILPRGSDYTGNYDDMDISLLYKLLRHICSIPPHRRGWGYDPNPTDRSLSANIERIRIARNQCVFSSSPTLSNADFNIIWSTVRAAVVDIDSILNNGEKYEREVDFLRHETMDPANNYHYIEEMRKQSEEDAATGKTKQDTVNIPPERFMAYMKNGMTTVRHARGIVVGCAEAGKTTLLYRLIGKSLDKIKEIKSTRGLHVYEHIFFVRNGDLSATENESFKKPLIRIPASELEQKEQNSNDDSTHNKIERETGNSASMESIQADMNAGKEFSALAPQKNIIDESRDETIDQDLTEDAKSEILYTGENERNDQKLARDVMEKILDARENETSVSMFDFAGQFAYYACHQIYMRSEAFYVLVMDMSKAFQDVVSGETTECEGSIFSTWTYKDYLYFWLDSIKSFSGTSAQVLTVATHTEGKTGEEKDSFWESLWALVPEEDKTRLYDRDFALGLIEMNEEGVHTLQSLKKSIAEVVSQGMDTKIEVPSAWALLEHLLQKAEKPILSISDINEENKKLPEEYQLKSQEEIYDFLSFFHSNGMLLFFMEEGLRTHAIFGIQWFSNAFSKLIADKTHINRECQRRYIKDWNHFNATGKLSDSLIDALWKEESSYLEHKAALMSYMERLRMLVSIEGEFSWYVPCMNNKPFTHDIFEQTLDKSSILGFRFTSFAMFVYYRLIAYCMSSLKWKVQLDKDKSQCLYHTAAIFETQNHTVIVGIIDNDIQIQVLRIKNLNPKVSCEIGKTIEIALTELTKTFDERKTFLKGYKCLNRFCSIEDLTFIPEKELSGVQCNCPIVDKHEIDAHWTLSFWKENVCSKNSGSSVGNLDGRASASSTTDDNILCFSCEEKHDIGVHYWEKNSKRIRTESEYLFAKGVHSVDVMTSIIKADVSRSVGLILRDGISEGTGFRVGEKYIMTCLHVIEKFIIDENSFECDRFCIQFGKTKVAQNDEPRMKFNFEPILHYTDKEYDVAILEMKTHQERDVIFAPPLTSFGKMSYPSEIHLIGHTGGVQMKEDSQVYPNIIKTDNYEDKRIKELSDWSKKNLPEGIDYYSVLREAPQKVLFNTTFAPGSSGSPGFMIKEQRAYTVLIVSAGVPKCYYENGVHVPANKRVEYGYALEDLNAKMQKSSSRIKALASEIFGECFRTS